MKKMFINTIRFFFPVVLLSVLFSGCGSQGKTQIDRSRAFSSYRDIPGVTGEEIAAIEEIRGQTGEFIFGMIVSTEAFLNTEGETRGYSALFCEWLTKIFGITFKPAL